MSKSSPVEIIEDGKCIKETEKAICIADLAFNDYPEIWIPKKWSGEDVIHDDSEVWKLGQRGSVVVKEFWAEKNNWI